MPLWTTVAPALISLSRAAFARCGVKMLVPYAEVGWFIIYRQSPTIMQTASSGSDIVMA